MICREKVEPASIRSMVLSFSFMVCVIKSRYGRL